MIWEVRGGVYHSLLYVGVGMVVVVGGDVVDGREGGLAGWIGFGGGMRGKRFW